jgi:hypothetical protein
MLGIASSERCLSFVREKYTGTLKCLSIKCSLGCPVAPTLQQCPWKRLSLPQSFSRSVTESLLPARKFPPQCLNKHKLCQTSVQVHTLPGNTAGARFMQLPAAEGLFS